MENCHMQANTFLDRHRRQLLDFAKDASPDLIGHAPIGCFLKRVYADFETVVDKPAGRPPLPGEDVFWWCTTILEELNEMGTPGEARDPYVTMMLDQLRSMGSRLANAEPLPPEFQIHWFDEPDDADG